MWSPVASNRQRAVCCCHQAAFCTCALQVLNGAVKDVSVGAVTGVVVVVLVRHFLIYHKIQTHKPVQF